MSESVIQASFSAGELSPNLYARVDFAKYRSGAAKMRNFFVDYRSGASSRMGTEFIRSTGTPLNTGKVRLVRFQQSMKVTYVLEFGNGYIRFFSEGASIVEPAINIFNIVYGSQTQVVNVAGAYNSGDIVFIAGVPGVPQINNRYYQVVFPSANVFTLVDLSTLNLVNSTNWPAYSGGGVSQRVYTIASPYNSNELRLLKFSQKANKMNITHPDHPPYVLTLNNATNWTLVPVTIGSTVSAPVISLLTGAVGTAFYKYAVTAIDASGQESVPSTPVLLNSVKDLRIDSGTNTIGWNPVAGAAAYNIYGTSPAYTVWDADTGGLGFIGSVSSDVLTFKDSNIAPDFAQSPPIHDNPIAGVNPQVSSYYQQRLVYANGGGNLVQTFWMSKTGTDYNFDVSNPSQANDAITGELVSLEVNEIKSMIPMPSGLIMLTTKGAWQVSGGAGGVATSGGPITPITATATPQAYIGANDVPPILINYDLIFIQAKGSIVRDLTYNIYANIYTGNDVSLLSSHFFYGHMIVEWAYAEEPFKTIWCVREDGELLSLTLVKEQDMYGWAKHDTLGTFESICTVTEGQTDIVYVAVRRPHPFDANQTMLLIERFAERTFPYGAEDSWCVDCGLKTIPNTQSTGIRMIHMSEDFYAAVTDDDVFVPGHIGYVIRAAGGIGVVTGFIGFHQVTVKVRQPFTDIVENSRLGLIRKQEPGTWSIDPQVTTLYGLDHFEGQIVSVLADGGVVNGLRVIGGAITLPHPASKVIAGLPFQAQLQTMYLDLGQEINTAQGKRKKIAALTVRCKDTRGLKAGMTFDTLTPIKELNRVTLMGQPISLITSDERIVMDPLWDVPGQICLQLDDPLPATILGVIPEVIVGDSGK